MLSCKFNKTETVDQVTENAPDTLCLVCEIVKTYHYNNIKSSEFGIERFEHDLPVGPTNIIMNNNYVYIIDQFHNNLKRIDLISDQIISSKPLSTENIWLLDFGIYKDKIYVSSELDSLYVFDQRLNLILKKKVFDGRPRYYSADNDTLTFFYPELDRRTISLDTNLSVISSGKLTSRALKYKRGKLFEVLADRSVRINSGIIPRKDIIKYLDLPNDIQDNKLVAIKDDSTCLTLFIVDYKVCTPAKPRLPD
jgi:hypothetical protein